MTPASFHALSEVTTALDPVDQRHAGTTGLWDQAAAEVGERLRNHPDLLPKLALDQQWTNDLVRYVPQFVWLKEWIVVHRMAESPETVPGKVCDAYLRLRSLGSPEDSAVRAIAPWLKAHTECGLDELIRSFGPPAGPGPWPGEELRLAVFAAAELRMVGFEHQRLAIARFREFQELAQYYHYQVGANNAAMMKVKDVDVPADLVMPALPDTTIVPEPEKPGPVRWVIGKLRGDH